MKGGICICIFLFIFFLNVVAYLNHLPIPSNPYPENGATNIPVRVNLSCRIYDEDNDIVNVSFYWVNISFGGKNFSFVNGTEIGISIWNLSNAMEGNLIGIDYDVKSGDVATIPLSRLQYNTTYYWYVVANDGKSENTSQIWKFTTTVNHPPILNVNGISYGYAGRTYSFYISSIDNDGDRIKYGFDWNGDGSIEEWTDYHASGEKIKKSYCWNESGIYYITIIAEDEGGLNSSYKNEIEIAYNQPPYCSLEASNNSGYAPLNVTFYISCNDDGSIISWSFDVNGDGTAEYGGNGAPPPLIQHVYLQEGNFTAILSVVDDAGSTTFAEIKIDVAATPLQILDVLPRHLYAGKMNITIKGRGFTNETEFFIGSPHVKITHIWFVNNETVKIELKIDKKAEEKTSITAINPDGKNYTMRNAFIIESEDSNWYIILVIIAIISSAILIWYFSPLFKPKCILHIENELSFIKSGNIALLPINQLRGKGKRLIVKVEGIPNKKVRLIIDSRKGKIVKVNEKGRKKEENIKNIPLAFFEENGKETIESKLNEEGETILHIIPHRQKHQLIKERVDGRIRYREIRDDFGIGIGEINVKAEILDGKKIIASCQKSFILFEIIAELKEVNLRKDDIKFTEGWKVNSTNYGYWKKWMCELEKFKSKCKFYGYQFSVMTENGIQIIPSEDNVASGATGLMYVKYCTPGKFISVGTRARTPYNAWIHPDMTSDEKGYADVYHGKNLYYFQMNSILNSCLFLKASLKGKIFLLTDPPNIWEGRIRDAQIDFYQRALFYQEVKKAGEEDEIEKKILNQILDIAGMSGTIGSFISLVRKTVELMEEINNVVNDIKTKDYSSKSIAFCLVELYGKEGKKYDFIKKEIDIVKGEFKEEKEKTRTYSKLLNITETFSHFYQSPYYVNGGSPVLNYISSIFSTALRSDHKSGAESWTVIWNPLISVEDITFEE